MFKSSGHISALLVSYKKPNITNRYSSAIVVFSKKREQRKKNEAVLTSSFINFEERKSAAKGRRGDEIMMSNWNANVCAQPLSLWPPLSCKYNNLKMISRVATIPAILHKPWQPLFEGNFSLKVIRAPWPCRTNPSPFLGLSVMMTMGSSYMSITYSYELSGDLGFFYILRRTIATFL